MWGCAVIPHRKKDGKGKASRKHRSVCNWINRTKVRVNGNLTPFFTLFCLLLRTHLASKFLRLLQKRIVLVPGPPFFSSSFTGNFWVYSKISLNPHLNAETWSGVCIALLFPSSFLCISNVFVVGLTLCLVLCRPLDASVNAVEGDATRRMRTGAPTTSQKCGSCRREFN